MAIYKLDVPDSGADSHTYHFGYLQDGDALCIDALTGCHGLICVSKVKINAGFPYLMVHDQSDGHVFAKIKLLNFTAKYSAPFQIHSMVRTNYGQARWIDFAYGPTSKYGGQNIVNTGSPFGGDPYENAGLSTIVGYPNYLGGTKYTNHAISVGIHVNKGDSNNSRINIKRTDRRNWHRDEDHKNCEICAKKFSFFTRKHHCRACGIVVCADCSRPKRGRNPYVVFDADIRNSRVCKKCQGFTWG